MIDLKRYIENHIDWSEQTFGNGQRTIGITKHIAKELEEIKAKPDDIEEWIDVIILAIDGAWRAGWSAEDIVDNLVLKQKINISRDWPPVGTVSEDQPSEHLKNL